MSTEKQIWIIAFTTHLDELVDMRKHVPDEVQVTKAASFAATAVQAYQSLSEDTRAIVEKL
jgi:hypothetical protein